MSNEKEATMIETPAVETATEAPKGKGKKGAARPPRRDKTPDLGPKVTVSTDPEPGSPESEAEKAPQSPAEAEPVSAPLNGQAESGNSPEATAEAPKAKRGRKPKSVDPSEPPKAPKGAGKGRRGRPKGAGKAAGTALVRKEEPTLPPMSMAEMNRLGELEDIVKQGLDSFLETGNALLEISTAKLYRSNYKTYADYLAARWNMTPRNAQYLVGGSLVYKALESAHVEVLPINNTQTRSLITVPEEKRVAAWNDAVEAARKEGFQQPQESHVKAAADRAKGKVKGDPSDVASARRNGAISPDTPVSVEIKGEEPDDIGKAMGVDLEMADADYLSRFNATREQLDTDSLRLFDDEALHYRYIEESRIRFIKDLERLTGPAKGPYTGRLKYILKRPDPSSWTVCLTCKGTGKASVVGAAVETACGDCKRGSPDQKRGCGFIVP